MARARWSKANHWPDWNAWIRAYHSCLGSVLAPGCLCTSILGSKSQSFHARTVCCSVSAALMASSALASACRIRPLKKGGGDWKPKNFCFSTVSRSTWSRLSKACLNWCGWVWGVGGALGVVELEEVDDVEVVLLVVAVLELELGLGGWSGGVGCCWVSAAVCGMVGCGPVGMDSGVALEVCRSACCGGVWLGWLGTGAGSGCLHLSARRAACAARRSPRKVWSKASCAVAGIYPVGSVKWSNAHGR